MTMSFARAALTAALLLGAANAAYAADAKASAPKLTPAVQKHLMAAQTATNKKDYAAALAELDAANQLSNLTPADTVMINSFRLSVHIGLKDYAAADVDAEAAADADPSAISDANKEGVYKAAMQLALNAKHYDKAAKYAKLLGDLPTPQDAYTQGLMAQSMYLSGDNAGAAALAQKNLDAAKAAGQRPNRIFLDTLMSTQVKMKNEAGAEQSLETLVADYNDPEDWGQMLPVTLSAKGMRDIDYLYVGRLWRLTGTKIDPQDASLFGSTASRLAFYGDAVAAEKEGGTGFPPADAKANADKKSMPAQIAAGAKQGGEYNVKTAEALYGYDMFAEAEQMARDAKAKGGAKDPTEPDMVIGMAETAQGKYADAATVFAGINQPDPASARIVRLWGYFAKGKAAPPPAAAPAQ